jgi:hypothetical protein
MTSPRIAATTLYAKRGGKPRIKCTVTISAPRKVPGGSHMCRVQFSGIAKTREIHGEGAMQALMLAATYVQLTLRVLLDRGWVLYYGPRDRKPFDFVKCWFPLQTMRGWRSSSTPERTRRR